MENILVALGRRIEVELARRLIRELEAICTSGRTRPRAAECMATSNNNKYITRGWHDSYEITTVPR